MKVIYHKIHFYCYLQDVTFDIRFEFDNETVFHYKKSYPYIDRVTSCLILLIYMNI